MTARSTNGQGNEAVVDSYTFAVDVFRAVCDRLRAKAADLRLMVETGESFEEWLYWEAFLACKGLQEGYPFCEVAAKPTYASEGVSDGGDPDRGHDGNRAGGKWLREIEADTES